MRLYRYTVGRRADKRAAEKLAKYGAITQPDHIAVVTRHVVGDSAREHFIVFSLDSRNAIVGYEVIAVGSDKEDHVDAREAFRGAILAGARAIIVAHNHPSEGCDPSDDDQELTDRLVKAGQLTDGIMRKPTIYEVLRDKLGREPTNAELSAECRRIISQAHDEAATRGKLPRQRKRGKVSP